MATSSSPAASSDVRVYAVPRSVELDELMDMSAAELADLFLSGSVPASLESLDGEPACQVLAVPGMGRGPVARLLRQFFASQRFPWAGTSLEALDSEQGRGVNRVRLGGERARWPFQARLEPSAIDVQACVALDYAMLANSGLARRRRDELRAVSPGLFLGVALLDVGVRAPVRLAYFSCDYGPEREH